MNNISNAIIQVLVILFTMVSHELAHGYTALRAGDDTAKNQGRLTWNPLAHIDPAGIICMFIFKIGWAKPVPINPYKFKDGKRDMVKVSLAGVTVNFITAFLAAFFLARFPQNDWTSYGLTLLIAYGLGFCVFNLLPIPPLDGSRVLEVVLPDKSSYYFRKFENISYIILVVMSFSGILSKITGPIIEFLLNFIWKIVA